MRVFQGIAVSSGIAISKAFVLTAEGSRVPMQLVPGTRIETELHRLSNAFAVTRDEIAHSRDAVTQDLGAKFGEIFEAHLQILNDPRLATEMESHIREERFTAEYAVSATLRKYVDIFRNHTSTYLASRGNDIIDIEKRLLRVLSGANRALLRHLDEMIALLAPDLTPSETANLDTDYVKGFATEDGGPGGHTAILAVALAIPAVVGVGPFLNEVAAGDIVIIDGDSGELFVRPDDKTLRDYELRAALARTVAAKRNESLSGTEATTHDHIRVRLCANIEFPYEAPLCYRKGADGIGLFRTEFLYMGIGDGVYRTEEDHFNIYRSVASAMQGKPVTVRTFDLGSDKLPSAGSLLARAKEERNPALGLRSIRLSLRNLDMFHHQLRAILRASHYGKIRIMFPLVSTLIELRQAKAILRNVRDELDEANIPYDKSIQVGMMLEVPAAILMIERFVKEVDFFSIGTNDLIQYTLAVDRGNRDVNYLFNSEDPSVLWLVKRAITVANDHEIPICLCGQMSSNPLYTMLLLGLGLREFSCAPHVLPEIKQVCRSVDLQTCREIADFVMTQESPLQIRPYLLARLREIRLENE